MKRKAAEEPEAEAGLPRPVRASAVLPWLRNGTDVSALSSVPVGEVAGLDGRLAAVLRAGGVSLLFPVQAALWAALRCGDAHDVCVNAPTGSGKTLAYALPLVAALTGRAVCRLRALVVLPTHDLAQQVAAVMAPLCAAVGLRLAVATGKGDVGQEAAALVASLGAPGAPGELVSCCDVLVATPGRLVGHVASTPGFSLSHLRLLVVDEVDRLLRQPYQGWLAMVLDATAPQPRGTPHPPLPTTPHADGEPFASRCVRRCCGLSRTPSPRLVKLCLSATLTRDPAKLALLCLHAPRLLTASSDTQAASLPPTLAQWRVVVGGDAPLAKEACLVALLRTLLLPQAPGRVIVFTRSAAAAGPLAALLCSRPCLGPGAAAAFSSAAGDAARTLALASFRGAPGGGPRVLVASDAATRGLDVAGVDAVVSFDAPVALKTYVHRVGRTARAGRAGSAFTLLRPEEARHFKRLLYKLGPTCPAHPRTLPTADTDQALLDVQAAAAATGHAQGEHR